MKPFSLAAIFLLLTSPMALAAEEAPAPLSETASIPRWEQAKALTKSGDYPKAREIYESLLNEEGLTDHHPALQREYESLLVKLIFSPVATPESQTHEVVSGDTLSGLAKKYGTTVELLKKSNALDSADRIRLGQKLKVPRIKFSITVEKETNSLILQADGKRLKKYSVATGEKGSTPAGVFKIVSKLENPTWYRAGAVVPPDSPDNILGTRWLGFDLKGYGIHGTTLPQTIGTQASRGCVRMRNEDVEEVYDLLPLGTVVTVGE